MIDRKIQMIKVIREVLFKYPDTNDFATIAVGKRIVDAIDIHFDCTYKSPESRMVKSFEIYCASKNICTNGIELLREFLKDTDYLKYGIR